MVKQVSPLSLACLFLFGFALILFIRLFGFYSNKKKLGKMVYKTARGLKNTDFYKQLLYLALVIAGVFLIDILNLLNETLFYYMIGIVGVYFGFATYALFMCVLNRRGLYEWGIQSMSGALLYKNIKSYDIKQREGNKGLVATFKPAGGFFNSTQIMFVDYDDEKELNRILRHNIGTENKQSSYGSAHKKKKRNKKR